jgi:hypothetical protein
VSTLRDIPASLVKEIRFVTTAVAFLFRGDSPAGGMIVVRLQR